LCFHGMSILTSLAIEGVTAAADGNEVNLHD
jgi:hypothetical protein